VRPDRSALDRVVVHRASDAAAYSIAKSPIPRIAPEVPDCAVPALSKYLPEMLPMPPDDDPTDPLSITVSNDDLNCTVVTANTAKCTQYPRYSSTATLGDTTADTPLGTFADEAPANDTVDSDRLRPSTRAYASMLIDDCARIVPAIDVAYPMLALPPTIQYTFDAKAPFFSITLASAPVVRLPDTWKTHVTPDTLCASSTTEPI
jgi:hypothetical protein